MYCQYNKFYIYILQYKKFYTNNHPNLIAISFVSEPDKKDAELNLV